MSEQHGPGSQLWWSGLAEKRVYCEWRLKEQHVFRVIFYKHFVLQLTKLLIRTWQNWVWGSMVSQVCHLLCCSLRAHSYSWKKGSLTRWDPTKTYGEGPGNVKTELLFSRNSISTDNILIINRVEKISEFSRTIKFPGTY